MEFKNIQKMTRSANYSVTIGWDYLLETLKRYEDAQVGFGKFEIDPDFQRGHVWDDEKRIRYVEFILRGGQSSQDIYWNHPGWQGSYKGDMQLIDGKQRLTAVIMFLKNELPIFGGHYYKDFTDRLRTTDARFVFHVNDLQTRAEVLQWYLDLNDGGVVHTSEEINRVRQMLEEEKGK